MIPLPEFLIDTCITVDALNYEDAKRSSDSISALLRRFSVIEGIRGIHICHIEECPPEIEESASAA